MWETERKVLIECPFQGFRSCFIVLLFAIVKSFPLFSIKKEQIFVVTFSLTPAL